MSKTNRHIFRNFAGYGDPIRSFEIAICISVQLGVPIYTICCVKEALWLIPGKYPSQIAFSYVEFQGFI